MNTPLFNKKNYFTDRFFRRKRMTQRIVIITLLLLGTAFAGRVENKQERCDRNYAKGIEQVEDERYSRAISTLSQVRLECIGGIAEPDTLYYYLGEAYLRGNSPGEARLEYRTIVEDYPHSTFREEATYKMAYCSFLNAPIKERDSRIVRRAMREFNTFIALYPTGPWADSAALYVDTIYNQLIDKELANAHFYEIVEKWDAAIIYYRSIHEEFPDNGRTDFIDLQIVRNLISDSRFAEARILIQDLMGRGVFASELETEEQRINSILERQERQTRRNQRRSRSNDDSSD